MDKDKLINKYKDMIIKLWDLLDDIDSASDIFKPKIKNYERYVNRICQKRHNIIKSDGYKLLFDEENHITINNTFNKINDDTANNIVNVIKENLKLNPTV